MSQKDLAKKSVRIQSRKIQKFFFVIFRLVWSPGTYVHLLFLYVFKSLDHHFDAIHHFKQHQKMMSQNEKLHLFSHLPL